MNSQIGKIRFAGVLTILFLALALNFRMVSAQALLDPLTIPKYAHALPIPARIDATGGGTFTVTMSEFQQNVGIDPPGTPNPRLTTVWGYNGTYPGPTFVARKDVPIHVQWINDLTGGHILPVDPTIHVAVNAIPTWDPITQAPVPVVAHLHGGHTESASDGLPEAWFTPNSSGSPQFVGAHFVKTLYTYDNDQEAATLWYHDHALGITRINVYAGLAGFYLVRDANEDRFVSQNVIPGGPYEIEIVVQDRMFTEDGELFYPSEDPDTEPGFEPLPPGPSAIAEFFGDVILVNGKPWPKLEVEPRKYRLRFLNGSDSRFYIFRLSNGGSFLQIGTDDGLLMTPVQLQKLLLAPGERADLVFDFAGLQGQEIVMENIGPDEPFKGFNGDGTLNDGSSGIQPAADPQTTGQIMKFVVNQPFNHAIADARIRPGTTLRRSMGPLRRTGATRNLVLFEGRDEFGRLQPLLGTLDQGSLTWFEPITENPMLNDVEIWQIYNATEDAHPIHLHLVSFQILNRESFDGFVTEKPQPQHDGSFGVGGILTVTNLGHDARPPERNEAGWKDTAVMFPEEVTRVIARFDRPGRYVWHCHILSHEDHEMMRPYHVGPLPQQLAKEGGDRSTPVTFGLEQNYPNPFNPTTEIRFSFPEDTHVQLKLFNTRGQEVATLLDAAAPAGLHTVRVDATNLATGVYFYRLQAGAFTQMKKMMLVR